MRLLFCKKEQNTCWPFYGTVLRLIQQNPHDGHDSFDVHKHGKPICAIIDDQQVAWFDHLNHVWIVHVSPLTKVMATSVKVDNLNYTLESRELLAWYANCIFCGGLKHKGNAVVVYAQVDGASKLYLVCPECEKSAGTWPCAKCKLTVVGPKCPRCEQGGYE